MIFIDSQGNYPRHIGDLLNEIPDWQEGSSLPSGWQQVMYAPEMPTAAENEAIEEMQPQLIDGILTQSFRVRPMTPEEIEQREANKILWANRLNLDKV